MFENLITIVIIVTIFWVGAFAYYFFLSRQQQDIADEIEEIKQMLETERNRED